MRQAQHSGLITLGDFPLSEVLDNIPENFGKNRKADKSYVVGGIEYRVHMDSDRYFTFKQSVSCACCGLKGTRFKLQTQSKKSTHDTLNRAHFNLFGYDEFGREILMTKDHITPRSQGGPDHLSNYQTMCMVCNGLKKDDTIEMDNLRKRKKRYNMGMSAKSKRKQKSKRNPALGYWLIRLEPNENITKVVRKNAGIFMGSDMKAKIREYVLSKSNEMYIVDESASKTGVCMGVWPVYKLIPIRGHLPYAWQDEWGNKSHGQKCQYLGHFIMGWSLIDLPVNWDEHGVKKEMERSWYTGDGFKKKTDWDPIKKEADAMLIASRMSALGINDLYEKYLADQASEIVTPEIKCEAARLAWEEKFTPPYEQAILDEYPGQDRPEQG